MNNETLTEFNLIKRALRSKWDISADMKQRAKEIISEILDNQMIEASVKLSAIKCLITADQTDLKELKILTPKKIQKIESTPLSDLLAELQELTGLSPEEIPALQNLTKRKFVTPEGRIIDERRTSQSSVDFGGTLAQKIKETDPD